MKIFHLFIDITCRDSKSLNNEENARRNPRISNPDNEHESQKLKPSPRSNDSNSMKINSILLTMISTLFFYTYRLFQF